ncbi:hypothetical protein FRB99_006212 [Tulasnella sp. 403]|nr:hypothetical protein FRB99_006212 [Tulasnella sp. 403]
MGKRPETPEIDTETKLVTIWNPWPGNLQFYDKRDKDGGWQRGLLRAEDAKEIVRWLSCIVGTDNVFSIYYKPKSHTTVIVEIYDYDRFKHKLLGAHRWDDTFKIQTRWCKLTDETSELCLPNPIIFFPEVAACYHSMTHEQVQIVSSMTTPGTSDWQEAKEGGLAIPNVRVKAQKLAPPAPKPIQEPNSSGSSRKKMDFIDVDAMHAVLGPPIFDTLPNPDAALATLSWADQMDIDAVGPCEEESEFANTSWGSKPPLKACKEESQPAWSPATPRDQGMDYEEEEVKPQLHAIGAF